MAGYHLMEGDGLECMREHPCGAVNLILTDLPYGTTQNGWEEPLNLPAYFGEFERLLAPGGAIVLFAAGMFTAQLMLAAPQLYRYKYIWVKSKATNFLNAKKQPLRKHEDILVFYPSAPTYHPQFAEGQAYNKGTRKAQQTGSYGEFDPVEVKSDGQRYPTDVLYFPTAESEGEVYHSTQKPIELCRWLIRTYSSPGEIVLDCAMGSGTIPAAALMEGRSAIGIEKYPNQTRFGEPIDLLEIASRRCSLANDMYGDHHP